jgi:hypothetical protein
MNSKLWLILVLFCSTLPIAPYSIVFHAASPSGIDTFEVQIDGVVLDTVAPMSTGSGGSNYGTLFHSESTWTPAWRRLLW